MLNPILDPLFFGYGIILDPCFFFCNGHHDFLKGKSKEKGKTPILKLFCGPPQHTRFVTMPGWRGTLKDAPVKLLSILF